MRGRVLGAALLTAALLSGCGQAREPADRADPDDDAPAEGTLGEYLRQIWGEWDPDAPDPARARAEELVAACMAEAGFEYFPMTEPPSYVRIDRELPVTVEVAEEHGYGMSIEAEGRGTGTRTWWAPAQETQAERANREYRESLSPAARPEYDRALNGDPGAWLEEEPDPAMAYGCQGRGYDDAYRFLRPTEFAEVIDAMDEVHAQVEQDPRVADALRVWRSCMAGAGYPDLTELVDARVLVDSTIRQFLTENAGRIDRSLAESEYEAIKASVPAELAAVQAEERAVAVADATCRESSGYDRTHREVTAEHEQAVVDEYRDELDAWAEMARERTRADG